MEIVKYISIAAVGVGLVAEGLHFYGEYVNDVLYTRSHLTYDTSPKGSTRISENKWCIPHKIREEQPNIETCGSNPFQARINFAVKEAQRALWPKDYYSSKNPVER
jgi:hypothetical protein